MWLRVLFTLITPITLITPALANGGGYHHGTRFTGTPTPFQPTGTEHVQILDEKLNIVLGDKQAHVEVRYRMLNTRDAKTKVTFGFPVEVVEAEQPFPSEKTPLFNKEFVTRYCRNYTVHADGKPVRSKYSKEPFGKLADPEFPGAEVLGEIQGWMVSSLTFTPNQTRTVTINYDSTYDTARWFISNDETYPPLAFRYRLSTGAVWAGPILNGEIHVTTTGDIEPDDVRIKAPANRFTRTANTWTWKFENLEPTLADDLTVHATPDIRTYGDYWEGNIGAKFIRHGERWQREHAEYTVTASSTLAPQKHFNYDPAHIRQYEGEHKGRTAWVEGVDGQGIGEYLDLKPDKPLPLDALVIHPGYSCNSPKHFLANSRPAKIDITLNGEHTLTATLKDEDSLQTVRIKNYTKPVKTVRLTIREIYPGTEFTDTAITNIRLVNHLPTKPKLKGSR